MIEILGFDSLGISPDPESEQAISNLPDPRAESCRYFARGKTVDYPTLSPKSRDSPGSLSTGGTPLRKISKYSDPHDTKQLFGRVWGNLSLWLAFSHRPFWVAVS